MPGMGQTISNLTCQKVFCYQMFKEPVTNKLNVWSFFMPVSAGYRSQCVFSYFVAIVEYKLIFLVFFLTFLCSFTSVCWHIQAKSTLNSILRFFSEYARSWNLGEWLKSHARFDLWLSVIICDFISTEETIKIQQGMLSYSLETVEFILHSLLKWESKLWGLHAEIYC